MQTEVLQDPALASPGDMADNFTATDGDRVTCANEDTAPIVVGTMVKLGSGPHLALKLTDSHEDPFGVVVRSHHYSSPTEIDQLEVDTDVFYDALNPGVLMAIARSGRMAVLIEEDVDFDDDVHVRAVATTGEVAGAFGKTDGAADTIFLPNCRYCGDYDVDDSGFGVAIVELNPGFSSAALTDS
jgi:hypothetical protein